MYLVATEANAKNRDVQLLWKKASMTLECIKESANRRDGPMQPPIKEALLNEVMNERERELVGEGYRLMDLKRWGKGVKRGKPQSKGLVLFHRDRQVLTDWTIPWMTSGCFGLFLKRKWMPTLNWQVSRIRDINQ